MQWWSKRQRARKLASKSHPSRSRSLIACNTVGQPIWTPINYQSLAEEGYQRNIIVYRCVSLIARSVASVPLLLYQKTPSEKIEVEDHPVMDLLKRPNPIQSGSLFIESLVGYFLLSGNTYIESIKDALGNICELYTLRPDRVQVVPGRSGLPEAYQYTVGSYRKHIPVDALTGHSALLHMKSFHPLDDWYGMSPVEAAARAIDQHNTVGQHNLALMQNGGRPSGALMVKHNPSGHQRTLSEEQRESLKNDMKQAFEGSGNAGRVMMLEGDFEWKEMGLSPKDLDFIEGKNLSSREISQAYGVPPMLVGVPGDSTFANYKEARLHLWEDTVLPLLDLVLSELNRWLLNSFENNLSLGYNADGIPALAQRREILWSTMNQCTFLTPNEKREALGYSPISNGDTLPVLQNKEAAHAKL